MVGQFVTFVFEYRIFLLELVITKVHVFVFNIWSLFENICKYNQIHIDFDSQHRAKYCLT